MKKFISIASHPGKNGSKYYNGYFSRLGLPYEYEARGYQTVAEAVSDIKNIENLAGISVSMPFKSQIIPYLDHADSGVQIYQTCNTIKILGGVWKGYNADLAGARYIRSLLDNNDTVSILGNGSMGKMLKRVIGTEKAKMFSRSLNNWDRRHDDCSVIINATALGTIGPESPINIVPRGVRLVIDLSIKTNNLEMQCAESKIDYVGGLKFYKHQFMEQFEIYTGICPPSEIFEEITAENNN